MQAFKKNKKALSLIEMLVVLLIISTTILTAMSLILRSNLEIKENEVRDSVNGLMVNINEAVKAPVILQIKSFTPGVFTDGVEYAFKVEPQGNSFVLTYVSGSTTLSSCDSNSPFRYDISVTQGTLQDVCVLVSIKRTSVTPQRYEIKTNTLYSFNQASAEPNYSYLVTNRYESFQFIQ